MTLESSQPFVSLNDDAVTDPGADVSRADARTRILRFLRQIDPSCDDAALAAAAQDRRLLGSDGEPTEDGLDLVKGFDDLDRAQAFTGR